MSERISQIIVKSGSSSEDLIEEEEKEVLWKFLELKKDQIEEETGESIERYAENVLNIIDYFLRYGFQKNTIEVD